MKKFEIYFKDDVELNFMLDKQHDFLLTTKEVALGYGVTLDEIRSYESNNDKFIEGVHWVIQDMTFWTKEGIIELGTLFKSERAKKFKKWCENLTVNNRKSDIDKNIVKFYELYGSLNPNAEFTIEHNGIKIKAYLDENLGFLISTPELAHILKITTSNVRAHKVYHTNRLKRDVHFLKLGKNNWWTREGAKHIALRCKDESFGRYLSSEDFDKALVTATI